MVLTFYSAFYRKQVALPHSLSVTTLTCNSLFGFQTVSASSHSPSSSVLIHHPFCTLQSVNASHLLTLLLF
jgi:hypothetical protein